MSRAGQTARDEEVTCVCCVALEAEPLALEAGFGLAAGYKALGDIEWR